MRGAGRSRAWWAAGGAGDPAGGSGGFCFAEPGRRHRPVGCTFIGCCSLGIGAPTSSRALSLSAAGGAYGPALSLAVGTPVQHPPTAHAAAGGERRLCRSATSAWSPASRLSRSPRWLSLGPRVPLWLSWDRAEPGAPGIPADPLQAGDRRARAPRALASPPRPSPPPSLLLFPGARG